MNCKVSFSTGNLQKNLTEIEVLEVAARVGADAIDLDIRFYRIDFLAIQYDLYENFTVLIGIAKIQHQLSVFANVRGLKINPISVSADL